MLNNYLEESDLGSPDVQRVFLNPLKITAVPVFKIFSQVLTKIKYLALLWRFVEWMNK